MSQNKIISFSVWGDNKLYCQGAIDNIACAKEFYPDWTCRFYVDRRCPIEPVLRKMDCDVITMEENLVSINRDNTNRWHKQRDHVGMMWKFFAAGDKDVDAVIFRDADSRLSAREAHAVNEWIDSGKKCHRMHEIEAHWNAPIMGGMWGLRGNVVPNIAELIVHFMKYFYIYNQPMVFCDLIFIREVLWPKLQLSCMGHGYNHPNPFKVDGDMVGSVVHEEWRNEKWQLDENTTLSDDLGQHKKRELLMMKTLEV